MWWENQVDSSLSRKWVHGLHSCHTEVLCRISLWELRGPKRLQNLRKLWKITTEDWGSVYENDSYLHNFISYFRKLPPGIVSQILSPVPEVWKPSGAQNVVLSIHLASLLKANTLGRACRIDKYLLNCTSAHIAHLSIRFLSDLFQLLFPSSCLSTSISNPCKWCTFESTGRWVTYPVFET